MSTPHKKKFKILIVDDAPINRMLLSDMLSSSYEIVEAENGAQAVSLLERSAQEFALVLLDIVMPELDGFGVLAYMHKNHWIDDLPVIIISSETDPSVIRRAFQFGVSDFLGRPFDTEIVQQRVNNTILLYAKQRRLEDIVAQQIYEKEKDKNLMVAILSHIVEFRNSESGSHVTNISTITELLLKKLREKTSRYHLSPERISLLCNAAALHDIGKISIPGEILNKPGKLTSEEFAVMKTHAAVGADMLAGLPIYSDEPLVKEAYSICRWHHERYDGKGYPDGLAGEEIPIGAQVVALADVYDALTNERCYKEAYSHQTAMEMIIEGECGTFNPVLLECLYELREQLPRELASTSLSDSATYRDAVRAEINRTDPLSTSAHQFRLIRIEREKYRFLVDALPEIVFSYNRDSDLFTVSPLAAQRLGINEVISEPATNINFCKVFSDSFLPDIMQRADTVSSDCRDFLITSPIRIDGQIDQATILCRPIYLQDEALCCGVMGRIVKEQPL